MAALFSSVRFPKRSAYGSALWLAGLPVSFCLASSSEGTKGIFQLKQNIDAVQRINS